MCKQQVVFVHPGKCILVLRELQAAESVLTVSVASMSSLPNFHLRNEFRPTSMSIRLAPFSSQTVVSIGSSNSRGKLDLENLNTEDMFHILCLTAVFNSGPESLFIVIVIMKYE